MRLWLSKNSAASLREQLSTQLTLGILSGDLKAGEKLPSVRELARRYQIHSNTVSAAYRDLAARDWVELRKGSGLYIRHLQGPAPPDASLDEMIGHFLAETRARGFSMTDVRARLEPLLGTSPVRRLLVAEPEPELREVLVTELRAQLSLPVAGIALDDPVAPQDAVTALVSRVAQLRVPAGIPYHLLRSRSVPEYLQGQQRPAPDALIGVASASSEILRRIRTILSAAGLNPDALEFRDARESGWRRGLSLCVFVISDVVTAPKIPPKVPVRAIRILQASSVEELRAFLRLVTDQKVS
jgi:GntR family transcriptional regulator